MILIQSFILLNNRKTSCKCISCGLFIHFNTTALSGFFCVSRTSEGDTPETPLIVTAAQVPHGRSADNLASPSSIVLSSFFSVFSIQPNVKQSDVHVCLKWVLYSSDYDHPCALPSSWVFGHHHHYIGFTYILIS